MLASDDDLQAFQVRAEARVSEELGTAGWRVVGLTANGPHLVACAPDGTEFELIVLGFVRRDDPDRHREAVQSLVRTLNRVPARRRIGVVVRRPLPPRFDADPVRRAVELWLEDVERGRWESRFAVFEDDGVVLEFGLTGEPVEPGGDVVAFALGPFEVQLTMQVLETRLLKSLDRHLLLSDLSRPTLLACVADRRWRVTPGHMRDLLYGKARVQCVKGSPPALTMGFPPELGACVFRQPGFRHLAGVLLVDGVSRGFLNPWAEQPLRAADLPFSCLALSHWEGDTAFVRWSDSR